MQKAVFLDRDGVINNNANHYYVHTPEDFELNEGIIEFMKEVDKRGYIFIVISNQSGIAKGAYKPADTDKVHEHFSNILRGHSLEIKAYYYCTHHPEKGKCLCRKPGSLLIEKAIARFNIDTEKSYLIGDHVRDVEAGNRAGIKGFKIESNTSVLPLLEKIK